jgi:7,8-dihydroneopterin 2',3'-cyclic phosphate phosphodiesterase
MDELIKLAEQIKDEKLREKTLELLKDPKLSNKAMVYKPLALKDSPAGYPGFEHHMCKGGLLKHTEGVTTLSVNIAKFIEKRYGPVNKDFLIAGSLLHDIMRLYDFKKDGGEYSVTPKILGHEQLIGCELYARGFPEEVIHMAINHLKSEDQTLEGMILHFADTIDAYADFHFREMLKVLDQELKDK